MSDKRLQSLIERAERVIEERLAVSGDLKEIFAEAKSAGYDVRTIRAIIRERAMDDGERAEREALLETYRAALGMPGATYRSVAEQLGVSKSKLQRLVPSEQRRDTGQRETAVSDQPGDDARTPDEGRSAEVVANPIEDDLAFPPGLDRRRSAA